jgi:hypothetical protein
MMTSDSHHEELRDKDLDGTLTWSERALLDAHTARCLVCRCERHIRADFAETLGSLNKSTSSGNRRATDRRPLLGVGHRSSTRRFS